MVVGVVQGGAALRLPGILSLPGTDSCVVGLCGGDLTNDVCISSAKLSHVFGFSVSKFCLQLLNVISREPTHVRSTLLEYIPRYQSSVEWICFWGINNSLEANLFFQPCAIPVALFTSGSILDAKIGYIQNDIMESGGKIQKQKVVFEMEGVLR